MSDDVDVCPFCGRSWKRPQNFRRWIREAEKTVITIVTTTVMVLLLKFLGL